MNVLKTVGLVAVLLLLGNFRPTPAGAMAAPASFTQVLNCQYLAQLTYTEMNTVQIEAAKSCDQSEAARDWLSTYGKMNHTELAKAIVDEAS